MLHSLCTSAASTTHVRQPYIKLYISVRNRRAVSGRTTYTKSERVRCYNDSHIIAHAAPAVFIYKRVTERTKCTSYITQQRQRRSIYHLVSLVLGSILNFYTVRVNTHWAIVYYTCMYGKRSVRAALFACTCDTSGRLAAPITTTAAKRKTYIYIYFFFH